MKKGWIQLAVILASAALTLAIADYIFHSVAPPKHLREVEHGVRDLRQGNPTILVLGSSHARTFHVVGQELARRTGGAESLVAVPVEFGKLFAYNWVLRNRLSPIIERSSAQGGGVAAIRLRRFVLLTEWWDSCANEAPYWNLPGRAWEFGDFVDDLLRNGITGYNRNYLQNRFRVMFGESALVHDRTQQVLAPKIVRLVRGKPLEQTPEEEARLVGVWRQMVEGGATCIGDAAQMESLESILAFARARHWETTVVLFPRKPATLSEKAKLTTLAAFADQVRVLVATHGAMMVDLTYKSPLADADFMEDFDHITAEGNRKFARWVLDHDLKFLVAPLPDAGRSASNRHSG